jgi:hypothetical protein
MIGRSFLLALAVLMPGLAGSQAPIAHVVRMTDAGFEPALLEIRQGESVVFLNDSAEPRWPASDIHPSHGLYPAFDPKRAIEPTSRWGFRFDRAGEWTMHDHLRPEFLGKIVVAEDPEAAIAPSDDALSLSIGGRLSAMMRRAYYRVFPTRGAAKLAALDVRETAKDPSELLYWTAVFRPTAMMAELLQDTGGGGINDCHQEAHWIGRAAYVLDGADAFGEGDASCHSGFYHGAMESLLFEEGTADLVGSIGDICTSFKTRFGVFECLHGIGHGLLAYGRYDLPAAMELCKTLPTQYEQTSCYGGVFMENIVTAQGNGAGDAHTTVWVSDDPHFPCNEFSGEYDVRYQCYQMQTSWMLGLLDGDFRRVAEECVRAPEDMRNVCFVSLGRDAAGIALRDPQKMLASCDAAPRENGYFDSCIMGAVNVVIDFWGPALQDQAAAFCRLTPDDAKPGCYAVLKGRISDVSADPVERREYCNSFEEPYRLDCEAAYPI